MLYPHLEIGVAIKKVLCVFFKTYKLYKINLKITTANLVGFTV